MEDVHVLSHAFHLLSFSLLTSPSSLFLLWICSIFPFSISLWLHPEKVLCFWRLMWLDWTYLDNPQWFPYFKVLKLKYISKVPFSGKIHTENVIYYFHFFLSVIMFKQITKGAMRRNDDSDGWDKWRNHK